MLFMDKKKNIFGLSLIIVLMVVSCKKETSTNNNGSINLLKKISYPDAIYHGKNILSLPDSAIVQNSTSYGFAADLEKDATLSITITDLSAPDPGGFFPKWAFGTNTTGWTVLDWADGKQKFIASQTGKIDLEIQFDPGGKSGICRLDFYENGPSITKTKYIRWQ